MKHKYNNHIQSKKLRAIYAPIIMMLAIMVSIVFILIISSTNTLAQENVSPRQIDCESLGELNVTDLVYCIPQVEPDKYSDITIEQLRKDDEDGKRAIFEKISEVCEDKCIDSLSKDVLKEYFNLDEIDGLNAKIVYDSLEPKKDIQSGSNPSSSSSSSSDSDSSSSSNSSSSSDSSPGSNPSSSSDSSSSSDNSNPKTEPEKNYETLITGTPTITAEQIEQKLIERNPSLSGLGLGQYIYDEGIKYDVNPVFEMGFFQKETNYGKSSIAKRTKNFGNLRLPSSCHWTNNKKQSCIESGGQSCLVQCDACDFVDCNHVSGCFCGYNDWKQGVDKWYQLISGPTFVGSGLDTLEKIIPKYAPSEDGNDVEKFIEDVKQFALQYGKLKQKSPQAIIKINNLSLPLESFVKTDDKSIEINKDYITIKIKRKYGESTTQDQTRDVTCKYDSKKEIKGVVDFISKDWSFKSRSFFQGPLTQEELAKKSQLSNNYIICNGDEISYDNYVIENKQNQLFQMEIKPVNVVQGFLDKISMNLENEQTTIQNEKDESEKKDLINSEKSSSSSASKEQTNQETTSKTGDETRTKLNELPIAIFESYLNGKKLVCVNYEITQLINQKSKINIINLNGNTLTANCKVLKYYDMVIDNPRGSKFTLNEDKKEIVTENPKFSINNIKSSFSVTKNGIKSYFYGKYNYQDNLKINLTGYGCVDYLLYGLEVRKNNPVFSICGYNPKIILNSCLKDLIGDQTTKVEIQTFFDELSFSNPTSSTFLKSLNNMYYIDSATVDSGEFMAKPWSSTFSRDSMNNMNPFAIFYLYFQPTVYDYRMSVKSTNKLLLTFNNAVVDPEFCKDCPEVKIYNNNYLATKSCINKYANQDFHFEINNKTIDYDDNIVINYENEITRVFNNKIINSEKLSENYFKLTNILKLPPCNPDEKPDWAFNVEEISQDKVSDKSLYDNIYSQKKIPYINSHVDELNEVFIVKNDWEMVLALTPIALSKNIPLLIYDSNQETPSKSENQKFSKTINYFLEDHGFRTDDGKLIQGKKITIFNSKKDVITEMNNYWKKFDTYITAKDYYYSVYGSWLASSKDTKFEQEKKKKEKGKIIPFIPESMINSFNLGNKNKLEIKTKTDVEKIIESSIKALSKNDPPTIVLTDTFLQNIDQSKDLLKEQNSLLAPLYAANRKAIIMTIDHYSAAGDTEACSVISAQFSNKIDGREYYDNNDKLVPQVKIKTLQEMGLKANSWGRNQGYLLILANEETVPFSLSLPISVSFNLGNGDYTQEVIAPSCDYDISRSRFERYTYVTSWMAGRIGGKKKSGFTVDKASTMLNRALFYNYFLKDKQSTVLDVQQREYAPYSHNNFAFSYSALNHGSARTRDIFNLYKDKSKVIGLVDPVNIDENNKDIPSDIWDYKPFIDKLLWGATIFINHAHGGKIPLYTKRGRSTIIINEGCTSEDAFYNDLDEFSAAYIGSTKIIAGFNVFDLQGLTLGEYMSILDPKGYVRLYGDPRLQPEFSKEKQPDKFVEMRSEVRGELEGDFITKNTYFTYKPRGEYYDSNPIENRYYPVFEDLGELDQGYYLELDPRRSPAKFPIKTFYLTTELSNLEIPNTKRALVIRDNDYYELKICDESEKDYCTLSGFKDVIAQGLLLQIDDSVIPIRGSNVELNDFLPGTYSRSCVNGYDCLYKHPLDDMSIYKLRVFDYKSRDTVSNEEQTKKIIREVN